MSTLLGLASHPLAACVGLALVHFVWQGLALGVVAAALLLALRKASAASRYLALLVVQATMALCPLATLFAKPALPRDCLTAS